MRSCCGHLPLPAVAGIYNYIFVIADSVAYVTIYWTLQVPAFAQNTRRFVFDFELFLLEIDCFTPKLCSKKRLLILFVHFFARNHI